MKNWSETLRSKMLAVAAQASDSAHDILHFERVVKAAALLAKEEGAEWRVVEPAAWLHDLVIVPKISPLRAQASRLSAEAAIQFLREESYPEEYFASIAHAIEAHSFSAGVVPQTLEARIVQDADRLDALGAVGIARCFVTAGILQRPLYAEDDPFCDSRKPDDLKYTLDHFEQKLLRLPAMMTTAAGRREGERRARVMQDYLAAFRLEI